MLLKFKRLIPEGQTHLSEIPEAVLMECIAVLPANVVRTNRKLTRAR